LADYRRRGVVSGLRALWFGDHLSLALSIEERGPEERKGRRGEGTGRRKRGSGAEGRGEL
jgi:hypothetical protein